MKCSKSKLSLSQPIGNWLQSIIGIYAANGKISKQKQLSQIHSIDDVVYDPSKPGCCHPYPHQNRLKKETLADILDTLKQSCVLKRKFNDFEELYDAVRDILVSDKVLKGDCLTIYDIALRLGQLFDPKIEAKDYVYLFRGSKVAAEALLGRKVKFREKKSVFDTLFSGCTATDIEDILCIYKNEIKQHTGNQ